MDAGDVMRVFQEALMTAFKLCGPVLLGSLAIGLVIAILQAATQIHEQTLTFLPKLVMIALMLLFLGSWMITVTEAFMSFIFDAIHEYG